MTTQLSVVNDCLAIMGETPLNSLQEDHDFKGAALNLLAKNKEQVLSKRGTGYWFNAEHLTLSVNPVDGRIYLPGDAIGTITFDMRPDLAKRGRVVYDLVNGTDIFPVDMVPLKSKLIRNIAIEDCPTTVGMLIACKTVLAFQGLYDGDQTKTRNLMLEAQRLEGDAESEHIRNRKVNMIDNSLGMQRIRNIVRQSRWYSYGVVR